MRRIGLLIMGCLMVGNLHAVEDTVAAAQVIKGTVDAVIACLADKSLSAQAKSDKVVEIAAPVMDFRLMAMLALGRQYWSSMTEAQRTEFSDLFVKQMQNAYLEGVASFSDERVEVGTPVKVGDKVQVETTIYSKGEQIKVLYKLHSSASSWKVYDIEIRGVSIVASYRSQYSQLLSGGSVEALLERMRQRLAEQKP